MADIDVATAIKRLDVWAPEWPELATGRDKAISDAAAALRQQAAEIERLRGMLKAIRALPGCECDPYYGHILPPCNLCKARAFASDAIQAARGEAETDG